MSQTLNAAFAVVGIDIGKNSFHIVGHDERGAIVLRQKWSRRQVEAMAACEAAAIEQLIAMGTFCERQQEACVVGSRTAITLGQRAQTGAKMPSERFGSNESASVRTMDSVPLPRARPSQQPPAR